MGWAGQVGPRARRARAMARKGGAILWRSDDRVGYESLKSECLKIR